MTLTGELWTYLADLNEQAQERLDTIMEQMKAADGGYVVAEGTAEEIMKCENSITGDYLSGRKKIEVPESNSNSVPSDFMNPPETPYTKTEINTYHFLKSPAYVNFR